MGRFYSYPPTPPDQLDRSRLAARLAGIGGVSRVTTTRTPQPKTAGPTYPSWLAGLTDAQIQAMADQQARASIQAMRQPILDAQRHAALQSIAQRNEIVALGGALANIEMGLAPGITAAYGTGADAIRDIGAGIGSSLASNVGASQAENDAYVQKVAPGAGPSGQAPNADAEGGVVTGLLGTVPGDSFDLQGDAMGKYFQDQGKVEAANVREDYMAALAQAKADDYEYEQQLISVAQQYPELRSQALNTLFDRELDKLNARQSIQKTQADARQQQFENQMAMRQQTLQERAARDQEIALGIRAQDSTNDYKLALAKLDAQQKTAIAKAQAAGLQVDPSASAGAGYMVDQYARPILDARGRKIPWHYPPKKGTTASTKPKTTAYSKAVSGARTLRGNPIETPTDNVEYIRAKGKYLAADGAKGVFSSPIKRDDKTVGYIRTTNDPRKAKYDSKYSFAEAINYLVSAYPGLTRQQARKALIAAGWKADGRRP